MKRYRLPLGIAALAITLSPTGWAQHAGEQAPPVPPAAPVLAAEPALTLPAAIERALAAHPELAAARHELEATEGALIQSGAIPNPELSLSVEDTRKDTRTTALMLNQPIELGGKRGARVAVAEQGREFARMELAAKRAEVRAQVVAAFHDALAAQARITLSQRNLELARSVTESTSKRVIAGKLSPVEETRARVAEGAVRVELAQAEGEARIARQRLAATWGDSFARFPLLDGKLEALPPLPSYENLEARLSVSPQLRVAEAEVARRKAMADLERARRVPDMTVSVGTQRDNELGRNQLLLGVAIPLPVFDRNQGNVVEAMRREDKARDELAVVRLRLASEVQQARERLNSTLAEALALRNDVLPSARNALDAASRGFELGKFAFLDVLDAQRTLFQAESQYLRALGEAHRAAADIDRLLGDAAGMPT